MPAWKKSYVPQLVKAWVPGCKHHGTDHDGWEYTSHGLWKKKLVWKPVWTKIWKPAKKQIWVESKKLVWKEEWKQIWRTEKKQIWVESKKLVWKEDWKQVWRTEKKQIWVPSKKLVWKEAWKQVWRTEKKQIWIPDKKLVWKEDWKEIQVPAWKKIWVPAWKKVWKPVWIHEWVIEEEHHHPPANGWEDRQDKSVQAALPQTALPQIPPQPVSQSLAVPWDRKDTTEPRIQRQAIEGQNLATVLQPPIAQQVNTWQFPKA